METKSKLVIYGSTPAAIAAAVQAKRTGMPCVVVSPETRIGGLTTGGLGQTDIGNKAAFGGIALEFYRAVKRYYLDESNWKWQDKSAYAPNGRSFVSDKSDSMWTFEPSAALAILEDWERRDGLDVRRGERLDRGPGGVEKEDGRIVSFRTERGHSYRGAYFIDATYEGDLMAAAGVSYAVGRESNADFGETANGFQPDLSWDHQLRDGIDPYVEKGNPASGLLPGVSPHDLRQKPGDGDKRIQAYCYRMCLTDVPANRIPFEKPEGYDERDYELLFRNAEAGADLTARNQRDMPNRKTDTNNHGGFSTDFIGGSHEWPEADYARREEIALRHLRYQQGLMWTLANHPRIPARARSFWSRWGTCRDEFADGRGNGWQRQLYIREARRMVGEEVMTERHCRGEVRAARPVALAAYGMDSHHTHRRVNARGFVENEGNVEDGRDAEGRRFAPYGIDYGAIVPKKSECGNLLVPVCLSATHIAYGSIRMEPVFFALGQAAATAAAAAAADGIAVQDVDYAKLRRNLVADGQVLEWKTPHMDGFVLGDGTRVRRIFRKERHMRGDTGCRRIQEIDAAAWIDGAGKGALRTTRFVNGFKALGEPLEIDVSASERFVLKLDGRMIAFGPHRGMPGHWHYESYRIDVAPGTHEMEAVVWSFGPDAPSAQMSIGFHGFILKAGGRYDPVLTTGAGRWLASEPRGTRPVGKGDSGTFGVGSRFEVTGTSPLAERAPDEEFSPARVVGLPLPANAPVPLVLRGRELFPSALLDPVLEEVFPGTVYDVSGLPVARDLTCVAIARRPCVIPPRSHSVVLLDLGRYFCAYPRLVVGGGIGATVTWGWAESLVDCEGRKGDRGRREGKEFRGGMVDVFRADGRVRGVFTTPWWRAGRWCRLSFATIDAPLEILELSIMATHGVLEGEGSFSCDDGSLEVVDEISRRSLRMCSHEMFLDCPYYEQQMYPGDARVEMLATSALSSDDRLIRQSAQLFAFSQRDDGLVPMDWPSAHEKVSSTFTLAWILMLADYAKWHDDEEWLRARMPAARMALDSLDLYGRTGLPGWNFIDWADGWDAGNGPEAVVEMFHLLAILEHAKLERAIGETFRADARAARALELRDSIRERYRDAKSGLVADTRDKDSFSEHAQALAILTGVAAGAERGRAMEWIASGRASPKASLYFLHYVFDACFVCGRADVFLEKLEAWKQQANWGLSTSMETPSVDSRSDCHGWSSHPIYHFRTGIAGIHPAEPFFRSVSISPCPGPLGCVAAAVPSPKGIVSVDLVFDGDRVSGMVDLPVGLPGRLEWKGKTVRLNAGIREILL